jgi:capsular exopolysaccharide synthesis family protein
MAELVSLSTSRARVSREPDEAIRPIPADAAGEGLAIGDLLGILKRRKTTIIGCTVLLTALAAAIVFQLTPRFTAEAIVMLDTRKSQVVDIQAVVSGLQSDAAVVRSEVEVLRSSSLAEKVVRKLDLTAYEEFNPTRPRSLIQQVHPREWLPQPLLDIVAPAPAQEEEIGPAEQQQRIVDRVVGAVQRRLSIINDGRSYVLKIRFEAASAKLAAAVANAYAEMYLVEQLEAKYDATRRATGWLNERLSELKDKVGESERAVQLYKERHRLTEARGTTVTAQQLSELNSQLILAGSDRAQKEATLRQAQEAVKGGNIEAAVPVLASPLIQRLREQEAELLRKEGELSTRYKAAHPTMINLRGEIRDLRKKIAEEAGKLVQGLANELSAARAKESALRATLLELQRSNADLDRSQVQLRELEREADANRVLYENFLARFKQTSEQQDLQQADARLVAAAKRPGAPSFPKKMLLIEIAFGLSLVVAVVLAFLIERLDNGFRSAEHIEKAAGIAVLGMLPNVRRRPLDAITEKPLSSYSEAIRSIRTSLRYSHVDKEARIVVVTSSLPQEGKTTFAASLGRSVALSGGKALLIDCDFRRPGVARLFGREKSKGLISYFSDGTSAAELIQTDEPTGLHFITASSGVPNPQDLLGSRHMETLLEGLRDKYDLIVLDAPPVLAVSDAVVLSHIADATVFLIRWERTPRQVALGALKLLHPKGVGNVAGAVLSRVNVSKHAAYGFGDAGYYYGHYNRYYHRN